MKHVQVQSVARVPVLRSFQKQPMSDALEPLDVSVQGNKGLVKLDEVVYYIVRALLLENREECLAVGEELLLVCELCYLESTKGLLVGTQRGELGK